MKTTVIWKTLLLVGPSIFCLMGVSDLRAAKTAHIGTKTVALWLFDEQIGLYPSSVLADSSENDHPLVIGQGGQVVSGRYGNAIEPSRQEKIRYPEGPAHFGLAPTEKALGRTVEPMNWSNAHFCALSTNGEKHLRKETGFADVGKSEINLGEFNWTVEFWFRANPALNAGGEGVVFELGEGPRGENDHMTRLSIDADRSGFIIKNQPAGVTLSVPSDTSVLNGESTGWHHLAFVYDVGRRQVIHYVDGTMQELPEKAKIRALPVGDESYFTIGRSGIWKEPLPGAIDELRFSSGQVYDSNFEVPDSFSPLYARGRKAPELMVGPPLLFPPDGTSKAILDLGTRKHLFIDGAILEDQKNVTFTVNPAKDITKVFEITKAFRKHLNVVEDENGLIRMYYAVSDDMLGIRTSTDGINWVEPDVGHGEHKGLRNVVIPESVGVGMVFIDPNAPEEERWKYVSGYNDRAVHVYSSPDGFWFKRHRTGVLPFKAGSQSNIFYDEQRQLYVSYHRSDMSETIGRKTQREFRLTETKDLLKPWPFHPLTQAELDEIAVTRRIDLIRPWYLDNGPLTPGGFGIEYPTPFFPKDDFDPLATDMYVPKAIKYPWAPDTYLAFPVMYFHYHEDGPMTRQALGEKERNRGSGPIETQVSVSRDGLTWHRYGRPAYVGIGRMGGYDVHQTYMGEGLIRRGEEIWQYFYGTVEYHSTYERGPKAVYRCIQRLDGFVSADTPYDRLGEMKTRALHFSGNRLILNIDTEATGFAQVGLLYADGRPIEGFGLDDCIYINGDFIATEVEWMGKGSDLSTLKGQPIKVVIRSRGTKVYSMQFESR